jgi:flavin reductase (DIM6/NTAB) family NADH-FMN oxidoreductase RutF
MLRQPIPLDQLNIRIHHLWDTQWFLLTSGDFHSGHFNTMPVSWGSLGVIWNRPFAQVFARPTRYTYQFTENYATFTLCAFPEKYHSALQLLGAKSGRDGDKIAESGLTPVASIMVAAPSFAEADLVLECRKIYWDDFKPEHFIDPKIDHNYPQKDYHRIYYAEILTIIGTDDYRIK